MGRGRRYRAARCVAWIDRAGYERVREAHDIPLFWPRGAAAAILYGFRRSDGCMAVQIDPLGTDGGYLPALRGRKGRWRRTCVRRATAR